MRKIVHNLPNFVYTEATRQKKKKNDKKKNVQHYISEAIVNLVWERSHGITKQRNNVNAIFWRHAYPDPCHKSHNEGHHVTRLPMQKVSVTVMMP